ncbi:MAG: hypothetical protein HY657_18435, partial [Acidobacteria bacterium]|nr:hypothetical protein [Acidobacteriota bacterium]
IKQAERSLAIYDPKVTDGRMIRLLTQRAKAGVEVRIIGKVVRGGNGLAAQKMPDGRLHVRAMIRDGSTVFVGSQSLRPLELDARREVGLIVRDPVVVKRMQDVFEDDWGRTDLGRKEQRQFEKDQKLATAEEIVLAVPTDR